MVDNCSSTCRICLFECNKKLSLFDEQNATSYNDLIKEYTGIDLVRKDNLPTGLCKDCEFEIKTVIKFISKVRLANEKLNETTTWNVPVIFSSSVKYEDSNDDGNFHRWPLKSDKRLPYKAESCSNNQIFFTVPSDDDSEAEISLFDLKNKKTRNKKKSNVKKHEKSKNDSCSLFRNDNGFSDVDHYSDDNLEKSSFDAPENIKFESDNESILEFLKPKKETDIKSSFKDDLLNESPDSVVKVEPDSPDYSKILESSLKALRPKIESKLKPEDLESRYVILKKSEHCLMKDMVKCLTCGILSLNKSAFIVHYRKHTGEKPHKCKQCKMRYSQVGTLNAHIRKRHPKEWGKMTLLAKKLKEIRDREFLEKCSVEPELKNEDDALEDDSQGGIKRNVRRRVICDICGKSYYHKYALNLHMRVHNVDDQIQCQYCPQRFVRTGDRILHIRVHHTGEKPYCCHMCGKAFASGTNLKKHLVVHSEERKFKCEVCGKGMKSKDNLKRHMLVMHEGTKSKVCHICGKGFALQYRLNVHMKNCHENKQSAMCEICKKNFRNIEKHMRRHTGDKPYKCTMCHKTFFQEKHLLGHLKKHQNENATFKCTYENCASVFSKKCVLEYHILKYHLKHTPHICQYCNRGFYRTKDLGKHMKSAHNIKLEFTVTNDFSSN